MIRECLRAVIIWAMSGYELSGEPEKPVYWPNQDTFEILGGPEKYSNLSPKVRRHFEARAQRIGSQDANQELADLLASPIAAL